MGVLLSFVKLTDVNSLSSIGLLMRAGDMKDVPVEAVITEDEFAECFGQLCYRMAANRAKRLLYLSKGWPGKMFQCLVPKLGHDTLVEFKLDSTIYENFKSLPVKSKAMQDVEDRSVFAKTSVKQLQEACVCVKSGRTLRPCRSCC